MRVLKYEDYLGICEFIDDFMMERQFIFTYQGHRYVVSNNFFFHKKGNPYKLWVIESDGQLVKDYSYMFEMLNDPIFDGKSVLDLLPTLDESNDPGFA